MSLGYAVGSIAGRALTKDATNLKAQIIDGHNFYSQFVGSTRYAADRTPYTQLQQPGSKGVPFGVSLEFNEMDVFNDIKAAIDAALLAETPFNVTIADDIQSLNVSCVPDWSGGNFITWPAQRTNDQYIAGCVLRFICTA